MTTRQELLVRVHKAYGRHHATDMEFSDALEGAWSALAPHSFNLPDEVKDAIVHEATRLLAERHRR